MCTNTFSTKYNRKTHVTCNPQFCTGHGRLAGIYNCLLPPILYFLHPWQEALFFTGEKWFSVVNLPLSRLSSCGRSHTSGSVWISAVVRAGTQQNVCPLSLGELRSMLLSTHINPISATVTTWFMVMPWQEWPEKRLIVHRMDHLSTCLLNSVSGHLLMNIYMGPKSHICWTFGEIYSHNSSLVVFLTNFRIIRFPSLWPFSQCISYSSWVREYFYIW